MEEQSEITKLQLNEKEEEFIGQCWDGIQDSGKLSMDGLGTLCETLGLTMDVVNLAMTDLGSEDLTMDCDDFMLLMGRMLRSGAMTLPQAGENGAAAAASRETEENKEEQQRDPNEMTKIELSEREEDYIGQCWDGVKKSDRLDMEGLRALTDTLGIEAEVINVAVTGLGAADCTMDRGEFMLLMGRLLRSGALKLPPEPDATEEDDARAAAGGGSWMTAMTQGQEEEDDADDGKLAAKAAAKPGNLAWMASMTGGADPDEEGSEGGANAIKPADPKAGMAWMATMAVEGEDVDEDEAASAPPAKAGMAAWMASMSGEDVDEAEAPEPQAAKAGTAAWMASMTVDDGEDVDEPAAPKVGAAAWMASMAPDEEEEIAKPTKQAAGMNAWMASMAAPEDEDN
mmetsp:Transcript_30530/g.90546  ORF Transcript_30530/g.90546 Transcript_30530/m.90546 type:complete len:400 (-) Transcript_30530:44-1243(-)